MEGVKARDYATRGPGPPKTGLTGRPIRPQMKRAKEHRDLIAKLAKGDEVITNGGIAGRIEDLGEAFVTVEIADGVRVKLQRAAIAAVLPKGTLKSA